jgi:hypothetical protein
MNYEQQSLEALKLIFIGTRWSKESAIVGDFSRRGTQNQIQRAGITFNPSQKQPSIGIWCSAPR